MSAVAEELVGDGREEALQTYSRRTLAQGGRDWTLADVEPPAGLRLYHATAVAQYVLDEHDNRVPVDASEEVGLDA